jgi:hypothetical protein
MDRVPLVANIAIVEMLSIIAAKVQTVMIWPIPSVETPLMVICETKT